MLMRTAVEQLQWCVVFTGVRQELRAAESLRETGYQVFLPLRRLAEIPGVYRRRVRYRPLFSRYLFCGVSERLPITTAVTDAIGVERVLTADGEWLTVPPELLAPLMVDDASGRHDEPLPVRKLNGKRRRRPRPRRAPSSVRHNRRRLQEWLDANRRAAPR
jgi:hypothetical protein